MYILICAIVEFPYHTAVVFILIFEVLAYFQSRYHTTHSYRRGSSLNRDCYSVLCYEVSLLTTVAVIELLFPSLVPW
jgi:hypothetical protein